MVLYDGLFVGKGDAVFTDLDAYKAHELDVPNYSANQLR